MTTRRRAGAYRVANRVTTGMHMPGHRWTLADVHQEARHGIRQRNDLRTWRRDEVAAAGRTRAKPGTGTGLSKIPVKWASDPFPCELLGHRECRVHLRQSGRVSVP